MWNYLIKNITLYLPYTSNNIRKVFEEGIKHNFYYYDFLSKNSKKYTVGEATQIAQEGTYDSFEKYWSPKSIYINIIDSSIRISIEDRQGLVSLSICNVYDHKQFEDEWAVYPDSHYYLRVALKLCAPFCIKSIETTTMH